MTTKEKNKLIIKDVVKVIPGKEYNEIEKHPEGDIFLNTGPGDLKIRYYDGAWVEAVVNPEKSFFISPFVLHQRKLAGENPATVFVLKVMSTA